MARDLVEDVAVAASEFLATCDDYPINLTTAEQGDLWDRLAAAVWNWELNR